jgi:hypothetical protein
MFYKSDNTYTIEPLESVLLIIQNCGDYWFGQGFSHQLNLNDNGQLVYSEPNFPFQLCLFVKNTSPNTVFHVYENSSLSMLLAQSKLLCTLCHISINDLYRCNSSVKLEITDCDATSIDSESTVNDDVHVA